MQCMCTDIFTEPRCAHLFPCKGDVAHMLIAHSSSLTHHAHFVCACILRDVTHSDALVALAYTSHILHIIPTGARTTPWHSFSFAITDERNVFFYRIALSHKSVHVSHFVPLFLCFFLLRRTYFHFGTLITTRMECKQIIKFTRIAFAIGCSVAKATPSRNVKVGGISEFNGFRWRGTLCRMGSRCNALHEFEWHWNGNGLCNNS